MALRIRRGTELERVTVVFAEGEIVYATDTKRLYVGDGVTAGGIAVADLLTDSSPQLGNTLDLNSHDIVGFGNINIQGDISATGTLTVPTIITDVQGSIFGDDSTPLVDGANNKLILNNNSIKDLQDVNNGITYLDQILKWDGVTWSSVDYTLGALTNVNTAGVADQQIIWWDEQSSSWVPTDYYLGSLVDVDFTNGVAQGQTIKYDQPTQSWLVTDFQLTSLDDVDATGIVSGDLLKYDGSNFVPYTLTLSTNDLTDIISDSVATGDILQYDGTHFVPGTLPASSFNLLSDVDINAPQVGETIIWDGINWVNTAGPGDILQTDVQGSVFGIDSSIIVDGVTNTINAIGITASTTEFNLATSGDASSVFNFTHNIDQNGGRPRLSLERTSNADLSTDYGITASIQAADVGSNGSIEHNKILFMRQKGFWIVEPDGDFTTNDNMVCIFSPTGEPRERKGRVGIGTWDPTEKLDVRGNITTTGFVQFGRYTTLERDDLTTTNNPQYATNYGMVIYNTTTNTFQGWANVGGNTPTWVDLS